MAFAALAGGITGAGQQLNRNRDFGLARNEDERRQAEEDRKQAQYEREQAANEILATRPDPEAIAQQIAQGSTQALPVDGMGPPAATKPLSYREAHQQWRQNAESLATKAFGFEGIGKLNELDRTLSQRMVLGYAIQGLEQLNGNNVNGAVRHINTALSVTPYDTGMKAVARDGKLYLQGPEGEEAGPYNATQLRSVVENFIKTPENWMDFRKQDEVERAARESERIKGETLDIQGGWLELAQEKWPSERSAIGADIYYKLRTADAKYMDALGSGEETGLDSNDVRDINKTIPKMIQDATIDPGNQWWGPIATDPGTSTAMQAAAINIAILGIMKGVTYADAIGLASFAYAPMAGLPEPKNVSIGGIGFDGEGKSAQPYVVWNNKKVSVPPSIYILLKNQIEAEGLPPDDTGVLQPPSQTMSPALDPFRE